VFLIPFIYIGVRDELDPWFVVFAFGGAGPAVAPAGWGAAVAALPANVPAVALNGTDFFFQVPGVDANGVGRANARHLGAFLKGQFLAVSFSCFKGDTLAHW
jgi:hypothetical protein